MIFLIIRKDMIDKLNRNTKVKASSLSNIKMGMFTGNGWQRDMNFGNGNELSYDFITYSIPNGPDKYLIQFCLGYAITNQEVLPNSKVKETFEYRYVDGMLIEYDTFEKEFTVLYYDMGIMLRNLELAIGTNSPNCYFVNRLINGFLSDQNNKLLLAIGGWVGTTGQVITDLFSALNGYELYPINENRTFPSTIQGQKEFNGGKLIQVISTSSGNKKLELKDHYLYITGEIKIAEFLQAFYSYKGENGTWGI